MMSHLSEDQIFHLVLGKSTPAELQHCSECPQCADEAAQFQESIGAFRETFQTWSHRQRIPMREDVSTFLVRPRQVTNPSWAWVAASIAIVMLASLPLYRLQESLFRGSEGRIVNVFYSEPPVAWSRDVDDVRLIEAVNLQLSRTLPAPMEPILVLIPDSETNPFHGEIQ